MDKFLIIVGGAGVVCTLAALAALGMASATRGRWGTAVACLASFAVILLLLLGGIEYAQDFWEGR